MPPPAIQMREAVRVVVAAEELRAVALLVHRRAAELAAPDDERLVEQAALLQVLDQRGGRPVALPGTASGSACMMSSPAPVPWMSQPQSKSWTKRTPCSTSRRASRQLLAKDGLARLRAVQLVDRLRLLARCPSPRAPRSACGRPVSYCAMRVTVSGSPTASARSSLRSRKASSDAAARLRRPCRPGCETYRTGSPCERHCTPWIDATAESRCPRATCRRRDRSPPEISTTKPGRFWFSVPRP